MRRGSANRATRVGRLHAQRGSAYFGMLVAVAIFGLMLTQMAALWTSQRQREREADLLAKGDEIRRAIGSYYTSGPAAGRYPPSLDDLVVDKRQARTLHHLRRAYRDPMTDNEWRTVRSPDGGIMGVFSSATGKPFRQQGFSEADKAFANQSSYAGWVFLYTPQAARR
ncbi:hypothetical protein PAQ31011_01479 [Pandoraea aquatica]|uniref:Type II secretory pathway, pseudopilin PulG n=1 Tax=Pandoraea aquatica TaxID=2508290 RepID=A0A5E4TJJ2_9BURK|nr:type II secretion system protein [Pandoraea aquatica]VVD88067.1 hypothetical protein PAQ31011_01479 [Pandoraea aquatica]